MEQLYVKQLRYREPPFVDGRYPFNLPFLSQLNQLVFNKSVTFIVGENGAGKSSIIESLACLLELNLEGGSKNNRFSTYDEEQPLAEYCQLVRYPHYPKDAYFYRAETSYNLMTDLDQLSLSDELFAKGGHQFSRGESAKALIDRRFFGNGFYLLDEPEAGLSFNSLLALLVSIADLARENSQLIIATHSPLLLMYPDAQIIEIKNGQLNTVGYQETTIFQEWQMLFERQDHFINQLLKKD